MPWCPWTSLAMHRVYANNTCLVVRGIKFQDGKYQVSTRVWRLFCPSGLFSCAPLLQFYFAAQEHLDSKTGAIKSVTTFEVPRSIEHAAPPPDPVCYGMEVKLMHSRTHAKLHSASGQVYPEREFLPSTVIQQVPS